MKLAFDLIGVSERQNNILTSPFSRTWKQLISVTPPSSVIVNVLSKVAFRSHMSRLEKPPEKKNAGPVLNNM
jgi:hypothetical protein